MADALTTGIGGIDFDTRPTDKYIASRRVNIFSHCLLSRICPAGNRSGLGILGSEVRGQWWWDTRAYVSKTKFSLYHNVYLSWPDLICDLAWVYYYQYFLDKNWFKNMEFWLFSLISQLATLDFLCPLCTQCFIVNIYSLWFLAYKILFEDLNYCRILYTTEVFLISLMGWVFYIIIWHQALHFLLFFFSRLGIEVVTHRYSFTMGDMNISFFSGLALSCENACTRGTVICGILVCL